MTEQLESLRQLAISIMVLLLIVAGAFDLYLLRQVKYANQELTGIRPQAEQYIANWQKQGVPFMDNFFSDPFFAPSVPQEIRFKSQAATLEVKPLPPGAPAVSSTRLRPSKEYSLVIFVVCIVPSGLTIHVPFSSEGSALATSGIACAWSSRVAR